jgi:uncharacterized protein (TIGR02598 family)
MKTNLRSLTPSRNNAAFSLVEVVLAVGIMALGVVTILGLLPHGMEMSRKTANEQAETRIVEQLVGEAQASDWATMGGLTGSATGIKAYFDDQGLRIYDSSGNVASQLVYAARVKLVDSNEETKGMRMPSKAGATATNKNLRRVMVEVAVTQDQNFNFDNAPPGIAVKRFTQLVANMRK